MFPGGGKGPGVTDLRQQLRASGAPVTATGQKAERTGPIRTASANFRLVAGVAVNLAPVNNDRKGLLLQNLDPAQKLFFSWGGPPNANSGFIPALGNLLRDVNCPTDSIWVFSLVDLSGYFEENSRTA
jgi:hypothetical protein